ncbi:hypothetical protein JFT61_23505 [Pseudomonas fluorescens]|nr:hypothetical protein [Pseudomonas fluorescens]
MTTIVDDSPAYKADILTGDMIVVMAEVRASNQDRFTRMAFAHAGRPISLSLVRNEKSIEESLQVNK